MVLVFISATALGTIGSAGEGVPAESDPAKNEGRSRKWRVVDWHSL
jgi:hypothetical protein